MTKLSFAEVKSMSFSNISRHNKISIASKHRFSRIKKLSDFHSSDGIHSCNRHNNIAIAITFSNIYGSQVI